MLFILFFKDIIANNMRKYFIKQMYGLLYYNYYFLNVHKYKSLSIVIECVLL